MESILAAISTLAILGGITAWAFAYKINRDWAELYRTTSEKKRVGNGKESEKLGIEEAANAINAYCKQRNTNFGSCHGCIFFSQVDGCGLGIYPLRWRLKNENN